MGVKISELPVLSDPSAIDEIIVNDVSDNITKRVAIANLQKMIPITITNATSALTVTGSMSGHYQSFSNGLGILHVQLNVTIANNTGEPANPTFAVAGVPAFECVNTFPANDVTAASDAIYNDGLISNYFMASYARKLTLYGAFNDASSKSAKIRPVNVLSGKSITLNGVFSFLTFNPMW